MKEFLETLFSSDFEPHGYCYLWNPGLVGLHVVSDALIALAYFSLPVTLIYFIRKRRDLPFNWMFVSFGMFILAWRQPLEGRCLPVECHAYSRSGFRMPMMVSGNR